MTSSFRIKNLNIFGDFWSDIDYNSKTDVFSDVICHIINNQCEPKRLKTPLADTFYPPAAQRKYTNRVFII